MRKVIYFDNIQSCKAPNNSYYHFLDYAFTTATYFMLVYVNYNGRGYSAIMKKFRNFLKPFEVKVRSDPHWPGVPHTTCAKTTYKVVFYRTDPGALEILKKINMIADWSSPLYPQDLAFFKGNKCWFYSVGHENIAAIIDANKSDLDFLEMQGLADKNNAYVQKDYYFDSYDEDIE